MNHPIVIDHAALGSELDAMSHRAGELIALFRTAYGAEHPVVEEAVQVKESLMALRNGLADFSGDIDGRGHYFPGEEPPRNGGKVARSEWHPASGGLGRP